MPPVIHWRLGDRGRGSHERSTENQDIPGANLSSNVFEGILVGDAGGKGGAARATGQQGVFRFGETGFVAAEEDDLACTGAGEGGGCFTADATALLMVSANVFSSCLLML